MFRKGEPQPWNRGRKAGSVNKATAEIRAIAASLFDARYWESVKRRLDSGRAAPALEVKLLTYLYGEPKQTVDIPGLSDVAALLAKKVIHRLVPGPTQTGQTSSR